MQSHPNSCKPKTRGRSSKQPSTMRGSKGGRGGGERGKADLRRGVSSLVTSATDGRAASLVKQSNATVSTVSSRNAFASLLHTKADASAFIFTARSP
jgi:hypothetical protein